MTTDESRLLSGRLDSLERRLSSVESHMAEIKDDTRGLLASVRQELTAARRIQEEREQESERWRSHMEEIIGPIRADQQRAQAQRDIIRKLAADNQRRITRTLAILGLIAAFVTPLLTLLANRIASH